MSMWQVESLTRDRVQSALREGQQGQLLRSAKGGETERTLRGLFKSVKIKLWSGDVPEGRLQLQERYS